MRLTIKLLFLATLLISCNVRKERKIRVLNDFDYKLTDKEQVLQLTKPVSDHFQSFFDSASFQVPIYRYIKGDDYQTYIGLALQTNLGEIKRFIIEDRDSVMNDSIIEKDNKLYIFSKKNNSIIVEHIIGSGKNTIYILTETNSAGIAKRNLNIQSLENRIRYK